MAWCRTGIAVTLVSACSLELAPLEQPGVGASGGSSGVGGSGNSSGFGGTGGVFDAAGGTGAGGGSTGGVGGVGGSAGVGGTGGFPNSCAAFCDRVALTGCPEPSWQECHDYCVGHFSWFDKCAGQYEAFVKCGAQIGTFVCTNGYYEQTNCENEWAVFWDCTWAFVPSCSVPGGSPSGGGCTQGKCDPVLDTCPDDYACSWAGSGDFECFPSDLSQFLCQSCANADCIGGLDCVGFTAQASPICARYCCSDADCGGAPGSCIEVGYFSDTRFCGSK